jgi:hypothetical protein
MSPPGLQRQRHRGRIELKLVFENTKGNAEAYEQKQNPETSLGLLFGIHEQTAFNAGFAAQRETWGRSDDR